MNKKTFQKITSDNYKQVQKWPKWKQLLVISALSSETGNFIEKKNK